ncbi:MAG: translation initiation factor [Muribaculaceae bacterium]|nr:translation initiation factor [Muribaculaceae bacterium]
MKTDNDWTARLAALKLQMDNGNESVEEIAPENPAPQKQEPQKERLDIVLERKGRGGKTATIICGFTMDDDELAELASRLKRSLGTGGSARGGEILVQGDRRNDVLRFLTAQGFKARII